MQIQTAPNILTTIDIPLTGLNIKNQRWEIKYNISQTNLIEGKTTLIVSNRIITILPEEMVEWMASWDGEASLTEQSYQRVLAHEGIVEWDGTIIDDIENDPDNATPVEWSTLIGQLIGKTHKVIHNSIQYDVLTVHTVQAQFPPPIAVLYSVSPDQPNGRPAWEQGTYADIGTEVTHNSKVWSNRRANNNQGFSPGTAGSGWMEIQEDGTLRGDWYNLGNEGYPINYIANHNEQCWLNPSDNTHWEPGVAVWTVTNC